jgi:hypothetical protein
MKITHARAHKLLGQDSISTAALRNVQAKLNAVAESVQIKPNGDVGDAELATAMTQAQLSPSERSALLGADRAGKRLNPVDSFGSHVSVDNIKTELAKAVGDLSRMAWMNEITAPNIQGKSLNSTEVALLVQARKNVQIE